MSDNTIEVLPVQTKKDLNDFIKLPWKIYKNDPLWVPPLIVQQKETLDKNNHPILIIN